MTPKYLFFIGFLSILISGCGGSDSGGSSNNGGGLAACGTGSSPYYGCWMTTGCQSVTNPFSNDPVWSTIRYNFASDNKIYDQVKTYTNSTCTGTPAYSNESFTDFTFSEMGPPEMLASGLTGYRLQVEDVTTGGQGISEVLVAVTGSNQLCLSTSLLLGSAEGYTFVFDQTPTDVDLVNNCLDTI